MNEAVLNESARKVEDDRYKASKACWVELKHIALLLPIEDFEKIAKEFGISRL